MSRRREPFALVRSKEGRDIKFRSLAHLAREIREHAGEREITMTAGERPAPLFSAYGGPCVVVRFADTLDLLGYAFAGGHGTGANAQFSNLTIALQSLQPIGQDADLDGSWENAA